MRWLNIALLFCLAVHLSAAVSVVRKGDNIILKNDYLEAEIAPVGGRLFRIVNKTNGVNMTYSESGKDKLQGGARDQLLPGYMKFSTMDYKLRIVKNTSKEAVIEAFARGTDAFSFIELTKTFTLSADSAVLNISVNLKNTPESMGDIDLTYGSHNYYGVPKTQNTVFIPMTDGIKKFIPNDKENNKYNNLASRGWIGSVDSKGSGILSLYDLSYADISFSWFCGEKAAIHTLEWHLKPFPTPAGETYTVKHAVAMTSGLKGFSGAGEAAAGEIIVPEKAAANSNVNAKIRLFGFKTQKVKLNVIFGKAERIYNCQLQAGKITEQNVSFANVPSGTKFVICNVLDEKGKKLFDLYEKVQVGAAVTPAEMPDYPARKKIAANEDTWDIPVDWTRIDRNTEFSWGRNSAYKAPNTLVIMPTSGVRDAIELFRRTDMKVEFPTVFPSSWQLAWRNKVLRPGENGVKDLSKYAKKSFDLYIIGGSYSPKGDSHLSWNKMPQSTRTSILKSVENGGSLLYINPDGLDAQLTNILKTLDNGEKAKELLASMDLESAVEFEKAKIRCGKYGKGTIVVIKFATVKAFLTPSVLQWANGRNLYVTERYDYQDYQFAVLAKLVQYLSGAPAKPALTFAKEPVNGVWSHKCAVNAAKIQYAFYNRYGDKLAEKTIPANGTIAVPTLPVGINRLKFAVLDKNGKVIDFGFKEIKGSGTGIFRSVKWSKLPIHAGDQAQGEIRHFSMMPQGAEIQVEITDFLGRLLHVSKGKSFVFDTRKSVVLSHFITAKLVKDGKVLDIFRTNFAVVGAGQENYFPTMLWTGHGSVSDYCTPALMNLSAEFGFSLLYAGYPNPGAMSSLQFSPIEVSANTYAGLSGALRSPNVKELQSLPKEKKIRKPCLHDPETVRRQKQFVENALSYQKNFGSERYFNMGDEMSLTWYTMPVDVCFSKYCLAEFRKFLKTIYPSLDALNKHWETEFKTWESVMPMTFEEVMTRGNAAPWSTHRDFMDRLFANNVDMQAEVIRKKFPNGYYGPTGLEGKPYVYGGGTNFKYMRKLTMLSAYGDARIPLSFDRKKRMIMCYRGYKRPEISESVSYWEGLFVGERGANQWYTWSFFKPDCTIAENKAFYGKFMWELRSGIAALLVNSDKFTDEAAILYSHPSTRSNFLKEDKLSISDNLFSFARYFEDRGMGYRFVLPDELEDGTLKRFKVLVLPEATAISAKQAQAIREFVKNGGFVVADYETALEDEWNVPQSRGMLDDVFGIRHRGMGFGNVKSEKPYNIKKCGKIKVVKGKAAMVLKDALNRQYPILVTNQFGKGKALYLNFRFDYFGQRAQADDSLRRLLDQYLTVDQTYQPVMAMNGNPAGRIMTTYYKNDRNTYIGLMPGLPRGNWNKAKLDDLKKHAYKVKFTLPGKGYLYDVRSGTFYGDASVQVLDVVPGHAKILALLPYKVTAVDVKTADSVKPGDITKIAVSVKTSSGKAGHHAFHMTVKTPDGKTPWYFRQTKETANGTASFELPFALDAAKGVYEITVKDAGTGMTKTVQVQCK